MRNSHRIRGQTRGQRQEVQQWQNEEKISADEKTVAGRVATSKAVRRNGNLSGDMLLNYTTHFQHPEQFEFHVITQDINDDNCIRQFEDAGYTVHVVTHKRKSIAKNIREVYQVLKQERFDIVHSHMTLTNFYVLFLAKMLGVRVSWYKRRNDL